MMRAVCMFSLILLWGVLLQTVIADDDVTLEPSSEVTLRSADGAAVLHATIDPSEVSVAGTMTLTVRVDAPRDASVEWPEVPGRSGVFRIAPLGAPQDVPDGERRRHRAQWTLDTFAAGLHDLPALTVTIDMPGGDEIQLVADALRVRVVSVAGPEETEPRELKPWAPVTDLAPGNARRLAMLAAISLAVAMLAALLLLLRRRAAGAGGAPALPPHLLALDALAQLERSGMADRGEFAAFHTALSEILRRYIEGRYAVPALEQTSNELLRAARAHAELAPHRDRLQELLRAADLVKFAGQRPQRSACDQAVATVRRFVEETAPKPEGEVAA